MRFPTYIIYISYNLLSYNLFIYPFFGQICQTCGLNYPPHNRVNLAKKTDTVPEINIFAGVFDNALCMYAKKLFLSIFIYFLSI